MKKKTIKLKYKFMELNEGIAIKVRDTVSCGLVKGLGIQEPGKMCIEAAVCYAYGLPHSDNPPCVGAAVRSFKIRLNDSNWSSNEARSKGMIGIAIAQLGSNEIDQLAFAKSVTIKTINTIISDLAIKYLPEIVSELRTSKDLPRLKELCWELRNAASASAYAYAASAYASAYAYAYAYAYAASAYAYAYASDRDTLLSKAANICLEVLKELNSPGCKYLYLLENEKDSN